MRKITLVGILCAGLLALSVACGRSSSSSGSNGYNPTAESITVSSDSNGEPGLYDGILGTMVVGGNDPDGTVESAEASVNGGSFDPLLGPSDGPFTGPVTMSGVSGTIDAKVYDNEGKVGEGTTSVDLLATEVQGDNAIINQIDAWKLSGQIIDGWGNQEITLSDTSIALVDGAIVENDFTYGTIEYQGQFQTPGSVDTLGTRVGNDSIPMMKMYSRTLAEVVFDLNNKDPNTIKKMSYSNGATAEIVETGENSYERIVTLEGFTLGIETYVDKKRVNVDLYHVVTKQGMILEYVPGEKPSFKAVYQIN